MSQVKNNPKIPIEIEIKKDNNNNLQRVIKTNQYNVIEQRHQQHHHFETHENVQIELYNNNRQYHVEHLSPIKPSFVNPKDDLNSIQQFAHSTPNHYLKKSPHSSNGRTLPILHETHASKFVKTETNPSISKKQMIVKELAVNILELNGYRTRTEQLDNELKNYNKLKTENNSTSKDYNLVSEKTEGIQTELEKLKSEMLQKIEDIHSLEQELVVIEGHNTNSKTTNNHNSAHRNEEVMNEIRNMLKDMVSSEQNGLTITKVYEEYQKTTRKLSSSMSNQQAKQIKRNETDTIQPAKRDFLSVVDAFRKQIENEFNFYKNQAVQLEAKILNSNRSSNEPNYLNEINNFKSKIQSTQENFDKEKYFLFQDLNAQKNINPTIAASIQADIGKNLNEKYIEFHAIIKKLYALYPKKATGRGSDSSFLTEEEEAIKKISEKIKVLKAKISSKEGMPKFSKKYKKNKKNPDSPNTSSDEDTDTKELLHLNEQIRVLKSRMVMKGDQLSKMKKNSNEAFIQKNLNGNPACSGPVYLPVNHLRRNFNDNNGFKIEPLNFDDENDENGEELNRQKYYLVNKSGSKDLSVSPERKYLSSIEIPAEQLENVKMGYANGKKLNRSRSFGEASSRTSRSEASDNDDYNGKTKKRHKSALQFRTVEHNNNLLSISLKSLKLPQPEKETMTEFLDNQQEVDELKKLLWDKDELINTLKEQYKNLMDMKHNDNEMGNQKYENLLKLVENQNIEINAQKNENENLRNELKNQSILILNMKQDMSERDIEIVNKANEITYLKSKLNELNEKLKSKQKSDESSEDSSKKKAKKCVDAYAQTQSDDEKTGNNKRLNQPPLGEDTIDTSLMCNIPEHHKLEDIVHQNREEIANLKGYIKQLEQANQNGNSDDIALLEKRAEFEALDLAINSRKKLLYNLEMNKNSEDSEISEEKACYLQDEIICLETTLRKRNKELVEVENELKKSKKGLNCIKLKTEKLEKEFECLKKKNCQVSKEASIFDKKADEATMELIAAQEELEKVKEQKITLEKDIEQMKLELLSYLKGIKSKEINTKLANFNNEYFTSQQMDYESNIDELKLTINDQRTLLDSLNSEISSRKKEIDALRDRSRNYVNQFRNEVENHENSINQMKAQKETLVNEILSLKEKLAEIMSEIKCKGLIITEKNSEIEVLEQNLKRLDDIRVEEVKKLEKLQRACKEKRAELDSSENDLEKLVVNFETIRNNETELLKSIEKLNNEIKQEKENYENFKKINEELSQNKNSIQLKLNTLNESLGKLNEEYERREQQLNKLNSLNKEKQLIFKREEEEIGELEYEKENLTQELTQMRDKYKKKKIDLDKLDETVKLIETKLSTGQIELNNLVQTINKNKNEYEAYQSAIKEAEIKLKDLNNKNQNKQQIFDQLNEKVIEKKEELENLESYLEEIKNECQEEKKNLNGIQSDSAKYKRTCDELKSKVKSMGKIVEHSESHIQNLKEMQEALEKRGRSIEELENKLQEKNKGFESLNQAFLKGQEEIKILHSRLEEIEHLIKEQGPLDLDIKNYLSNIENRADLSSLLNEEQLKSNVLQPKSLISSLLITPTLRKSNNVLESTEWAKQQSTATSKLSCSHGEPRIDYCDKHNRFKEKLCRNFHENMCNLERSKLQTQSYIDSLRSSLSEIEIMTANNIFKLTNMKN